MMKKLFNISSGTKTQEEDDALVLVQEEDINKIILFNDEVNTFDFVIESLIKVCGHEALQAEQCTMIIHFNGKCDVKMGTYKDLEPKCTALLDRGLSAEIQ